MVRREGHREERGKVMVKYADGIGTHSDLHTRGCRIRSCKRRVDLDELYREYPWMKCPFAGQQEGCECWPCRSSKWPARYTQWVTVGPNGVRDLGS